MIVFMVVGPMLVFVGLPSAVAAGLANLVNDGGFPAQRPSLHLDFDGCSCSPSAVWK